MDRKRQAEPRPDPGEFPLEEDGVSVPEIEDAEPDSVRKGDTLALVFITLMYLSLAGAAAFGIVRFVRKRREATE